MSNIKTKGFDSPEQMREYLEELEDVTSTTSSRERSIRREISVLRAKIEDLRIRVEEMQHLEDRQPLPSGGWLRIASAVVLTFVVGRLSRQFGFGRLGALAAPFLATYMNKRLWPAA